MFLPFLFIFLSDRKILGFFFWFYSSSIDSFFFKTQRNHWSSLRVYTVSHEECFVGTIS